MAKDTASRTTGLPELDAFNAWTARYLAATDEEKTGLLDQGIALATARRPALARLIPSDPRRAIENAVSPIVRQELPAAVAVRLEERVNERAFFGVLGIAPSADAPEMPAYRREVRTDDGGYYQAFVYGNRGTQQTTASAFIVGIAVDNVLAVDERPLRTVAAGEIPNHPNNLTRRRTVVPLDERGFTLGREVRETPAPAREIVETCPVSGKSTAAPKAEDGSAAPVTEQQVVVEAGGQVHFLCSGGHILGFEGDLIAQEGGNGGPSKPTTPPAATQGTGYKSHLLMRVAFPEALKGSVTEAEGHTLGKNVQDWFVDSSFGAMTFLTTVSPLIVLPRTEAWYKSQDTGSAYEVLWDARVAAKLAGFDPANFDFDTVIYTGTPGGFGGQAYVGGKGCWLKSGTGTGVAVHEYGHNFGLWHSNFWSTTNGSAIGGGSHVEYGDNFDTMGSANAGDYHFNAYQKNLLNWMPTAVVHDVASSGSYRIYQMDQPTQDPRQQYAIKIRKDADRDYWVDFRQKFASNAWVQGGVFLHWSPWAPSGSGPHLLDMTPGSVDGKNDAPLVVGRTFSDLETGIHITPVAKNATTPPSMDVVVNIGTFVGNQVPGVALGASATSVGTGVAVNFTATASDPDGDTLSYAWDFGDKSFSTLNSPTVSKSWATAGEYRVRCTVSDMKGQTASSSVIITVGSPTTFRVSGTITAGGLPLHGVRVTTNSRDAYTESNGTYTITGLAAGTYTLTTQLYGYTLTPTGSATVTVGPSASGVDFTATDLPQVSIALQDSDCAEGANTGTFRISRTGSTAAALTVSCYSPSGTAGKGTDYTLAPDVVSGSPFYTLTIPAGQAFLDVVVTALDDTASESFERTTLELVPQTAYVLGNAAATLMIADTDTALSLVRMRVSDRDALESGDAGQFVIERIGSTSNSLSVSVAISGTATNGTDYATIPTTVTIAAGASTAAVNVAPLQDSVVEPMETVTLTINTNAAYIRVASSAEYAGTVNLHDDDAPTLTVVATDSAAAEAGTDSGVFTVTRTGDTSQALTVNYGITGSALHGTDYIPLPGVLTIPAGSATATIVITPIDDAIGEAAQTAVFQLRSGTGYAVGAASNATVTITDNGDVPYATINLTAGPAVEGGAAGTFRITTTGTGTGNITVGYTVSGTATNGTDYSLLSGTVSMAKNATSNITITTLQDALIEGYETITLTLNPDPAYSLAVDSSASMNLQDDDAPQINVSGTDDAFSEADGSLAKFYVSRTGSTTNALTVNYTMGGTATSGVDYNAPSGSVTIAAGAAGAFVDISMFADTLAEGTETITLTVTPGGSYSAGFGSATRYIADAQSASVPTQVRFSASTSSAAENAGTVNIPVTLSAAAAGTVTVEYYINGGTALGGSVDYKLSPGVLTFAPGETTKNIPVELLMDTITENNETLVIALANPVNSRLGTSSHTLTLTNYSATDTTPPSVVVTPSGTATSGSPITFTLTFSEPVTGLTAAEISVSNGSAGVLSGGGSVYTIPVTPSAQGAVTCLVIAGAAQDAAGNNSTASNIASVTYDSVAPAVSIGAPSVTSTTVGPVSYTVTYSDTNFASSTLAPGNITLNSTGTASGAVGVSGTGNTRTVTISGISGEGTLGISIAAGTATDTAGNTAGAAGPSATFAVVKTNQTITFGALAAKTYGNAPFALTATASSGLPVSYVSSDPAVATVSGNTVTIVGAGSTTITASQAGNSSYYPAPDVAQVLTVNKASQSITFNALSNRLLGGAPFNLNATATSGLVVSYVSSDPSVATVSGNTVTIVGVGSTTITASQAGDGNYNPAADVNQTLTVVTALTLAWDANGTGAGQTNGAGAWLGANLWWDGIANQSWTAGSNAIFGGPNTAGGAVTLASPTTVNSINFSTFTGTYTLGTAGQTLTINSGIDKAAGSGTVSIISPVAISGSQTWTNNSTSTLTASAALDTMGNLLTVDGTGTTSLTGVISGSGGIVKNGTGRLTFNTANANTYTGQTTINGGVLMMANNLASIGSGNVTLNGGVLEAYWGLSLTRALGNGDGQIQITGGASGFGESGSGQTLTVNFGNNAANEAVWGSTHFNPSTLVLQTQYSLGTSALTLANNMDLNGATRTMQVSGGASGTATATLSGVIRSSSGTAGIIKTGTGNLILSAANTFTGDIAINAGSLQIGNNTAATLAGGTYNGAISVASGSTFRVFSSANQTLSGVISGGGGLTKSYAGTLTLSNANTYTGKTSIAPQTTAGAGTLVVSSFNSVSGGTASSSLGAPTTVANGTVDFGSATTQAGATLRYTGSGETTDRVINFLFNGNGATKTLDAAGTGLLKFTSAFTGSGSATNAVALTGTGNGEIVGGLPFTFSGLTKSGSGTWTLGGTIGNTGTTTISAGRLALGASNVLLNTSPVSIGAATLDAATYSDVLGTLDVTAAATISLGAGGSLQFADSSAVDWTGGTLVITGNFVRGASIRFGSTAAALTAAQLAKISVAGFGPLTLDANGYLTDDATPPTLVGISDNSGGAVLIGGNVTFTVTFSEDMDASTVSEADFGNAGTCAGVIGTVSETSPGVFTVPVTVTTIGTLRLKINAGAVLGDVAGNLLATGADLVDDTVITVNPGPVASFSISPISGPQNVGTPITGITVTARDLYNNTATSFTGTVNFGGTGGFSGTSANFVSGVLSGVSVTPTVSGSNLTFTVDNGAGNIGSTTIATVNKAVQTITFDALAAQTFGSAPFTLNATASSGLAVSYVSSNPAVATVSGNTVTIIGGGTTTITASQGGDAIYEAAADVAQVLTVNKADQTITFNALAARTYGGAPFALDATARSGLAVSYVSSDPAVATVSGNTVTIIGVGATTITATQAGNANFNAAADVAQVLTVNKADQAITFNALAERTFGGAPFALDATASSGLAVSYVSSDPAVATVSGSTVTITGGGTTTITASQAGDSNFEAAADVVQVLTVNKATQTITFNALAARTYGGAPFALDATASSGLAVSYISSNPAVATVSGNTVTIAGGGTTTITASQAGNANYEAAASVPQTLTVNQASQTITFAALAPKMVGDAPFALGATASSGLVVSYASSNPAVATVSGNTVTIVGAGTTDITASQVGDANYSPAPDVVQSLVVSGPLPPPWVQSDIGSPGAVGTGIYGGGVYSISGAGTISGKADKFHFAYQTLSSDGEIVVRIPSFQNTGNSARIGVMMRDTLATGSRYGFVGVNGGGTFTWLRRTSTGGNTSSTTSGTGTAPNVWVKLTRVGSTITASRSTNGTTWTTIGSNTVTMAANCYIGIAVASGTTALNASTFDNVSVVP